MYPFIIVDDEPLIRMGTLKKLETLNEKIHCVGEAGNGEQALELIERYHPAFVILDMEMPVMDGPRLLPFLAEHFPDMQLIVISGYKSFDYIKYAISANVIDYILKPFDLNEVLVRMEVVLRRGRTNKGETGRLEIYNLTLDTANGYAEVKGIPLKLTAKECALLQLFLAHPQKTFSKANLYETIWQAPYFYEDNTLNVHMSNLRNKLKKADGENEYIETVWGIGYRLAGGENIRRKP